MKARSILIVGGGPAGMALAYLLARRGVGVTVLEAHRDFSRSFRGEGLQQSGIDAIRQMGLGEQLDKLPQVEMKTIEVYRDGQLRFRLDPTGLGRGGARLVSQPAFLDMLAQEAGQCPSFRLDFGVTVRELLSENGRIVGVRADSPDGPRHYSADLVIGADGRHSVTRKYGDFQELTSPQDFDLVWVKLPMPESWPDRRTAMFETGRGRMVLAFPSADGQLQVGMVVPKGGYQALRGRGETVWTEELISKLPAPLAGQLRAHREALDHAGFLNVVCGRLTRWTAPGLLLIGDAAHPMSPVGGQGLNIALRDSLVAANHLCPVLAAGGDDTAIDAAAALVREERWPEIVAVQEMQQKQARIFHANGWKGRLINALLPLLLRTGLLQKLNRQHYHHMSYGVVPVKLTA